MPRGRGRTRTLRLLNKRERVVGFVEIPKRAPDLIQWGGKFYRRRFSDSDNYIESTVLVLDENSPIRVQRVD